LTAFAYITCEKLVAVLKEERLEDIAEIFRKENIDGNLFSELTKDDMDEIKIPTGFKLKKLQNIKSKLPKE
jgi:phosphoribosylformylglycinamidine (FGAM) synthase-like enzyme